MAAGKTRAAELVADLEAISRNGPLPVRLAAIRGLGFARPANLEADFQKLILSREPNEIRSEALRVMARSDRGANMILDLEQKQKLPAELRNLAANLVGYNRTPAIRARAAKILPPPVSKSKRALPPARMLIGREGDAAAGRKVYFAKVNGPDCAGCHAIEEGKPTTGPNLAAIGGKLGKDALLDSILNPSSAIAHEYVTWILDTKTQGQVIGILAEDTPQRVVVKTENGEAIRLKPQEITSRRKSNLSMMPEDLTGKMTEQQLVNLLEFLTTLKEKGR
jgi:putative heme-binding domain-containing protein